MTAKRFTHKKWYDERQLFDGDEAFAIVDSGTQASILCNKLNKLSDENEQLKQVLGSILIEVRREISATNHSSEVKAFVNPNSFDLISNVLKKYGALKDCYE